MKKSKTKKVIQFTIAVIGFISILIVIVQITKVFTHNIKPPVYNDPAYIKLLHRYRCYNPNQQLTTDIVEKNAMQYTANLDIYKDLQRQIDEKKYPLQFQIIDNELIEFNDIHLWNNLNFQEKHEILSTLTFLANQKRKPGEKYHTFFMYCGLRKGENEDKIVGYAAPKEKDDKKRNIESVKTAFNTYFDWK